MSKSVNKAIVWSFYDKNFEQKTVICKICKKSYKDFGNTTNLISHIKNKHPIQYKDSSGECSSSQACSSSEGDSSASTFATNNSISKKRRYQQLLLAKPNASLSKQKEKRISLALTKMICQDLQPLQIVENKGFINFCQEMNPDYVLPSRKSLREKILSDAYHAARSAIVDILHLVEHMAATTDLWTSDSNKAYLTVTIHFIHNSKLYSQTISTREVAEEHSAIILGSVLKSIFEEWQITEKIVTIVSDNAPNIKKAISEYLCKRNHYCVAHTELGDH